jgi:hypothetical protein
VRLADPSNAVLVRAGSVVDVLATAADPVAGGALADVVASGVRVVRVPDAQPSATADGAVLVVAVTPTTARVLAAAASQRLSIAVRSTATGP